MRCEAHIGVTLVLDHELAVLPVPQPIAAADVLQLLLTEWGHHQSEMIQAMLCE